MLYENYEIMAVFRDKFQKIIQKFANLNLIDLEEKLKKEPIYQLESLKLANLSSLDKKDIEKRINFIENFSKVKLNYITEKRLIQDLEVFRGNIENYIGVSKIPIGLVGPLKVKGLHAYGVFYVPMATTEGALVASYTRGSIVTYLSGGITSWSLVERVSRVPAFKFNNLIEIGKFTIWVSNQFEKFKEITKNNSNHAELEDIMINISGNIVFISFDFNTKDAAGQNMTTIITDNICRFILENSPIKPVSYFIESNLSGDKKASYLSYMFVRGRKVVSEAIIDSKLIEKYLNTTSEKINEYVNLATLAAMQSGTLGAQGHYANALAAIFIACGQDVACVSEAAVGITRTELIGRDLYISVNIPNLIVGTVGGGTSLPTQRECLEIMGCYGESKANKFAEIIGAAILAGELSLIASISANDFAQAHKKYRKPKK
jgi:hydroxymethylglutaryl-CoA reductase (NADPH)